VRGDALHGGDTRVKSIKSDSDVQKKVVSFSVVEQAETVMTKKARQFFSGKNRGDTLSCRPG